MKYNTRLRRLLDGVVNSMVSGGTITAFTAAKMIRCSGAAVLQNLRSNPLLEYRLYTKHSGVFIKKSEIGRG